MTSFPYRKPVEPSQPLDENLIVLYSFPDYSGNALAFYEYLSNKTFYKTVWAVKNPDVVIALKSKGINCFCITDRQTAESWIYKAKYFVTTHEFDNYFHKIKGQVYVLLCHSLQLAQEAHNNTLLEDTEVFKTTRGYFRWEGAVVDIQTATSELTKMLHAAIHPSDPRKVIVTGEPRCDYMFNTNGRVLLENMFGWNGKYKHIMLYTPSSRRGFGQSIGDAFKLNIFNFNSFDEEKFSAFLEANSIAFLVRLHPQDVDKMISVGAKLPDHCYNLSNEILRANNISQYHILNGVDAMLGDVSSILFEYMLLDRPIIRVWGDSADFINIHKSGLGNPDFWFPETKVYEQDGLEAAMLNAVKEPQLFSDGHNQIRKMLFQYKDGNASRRLLEAMEKYVELENHEFDMYTSELQEALTVTEKARETAAAERDNVLSERDKLIHDSDALSAVLQESRDTYLSEIKMLAEHEKEITAEMDRILAERDSAISERDNVTTERNSAISERDNVAAERNRAISERDNLLHDSDALSAALRQSRDTYLSEIKMLSENEREITTEMDRAFGELGEIKSSRAWRLMLVMWRFSGAMIPHGSKRRLAAKVAWRFVRHPIRFLKVVKPRRISNFFKVLKSEGTGGVSRRIDFHYYESDSQKQELVIEQYSEQKSISDFDELSFPNAENPKVSVIIPVYNQFSYTYGCLSALLNNTADVTYEIILADDNSDDITKDISQVVNGIRIIRNPENLRFLLNCNNAANQARGEYIVFLNNDTQVQQNWLEPLVRLMEQDETIGMTGSKLVFPDGTLQEAGGILWNDGSGWNYGRGSDPELPEFNYVKEVDYISGASICIRKSLWEQIGGFDERFSPAYCEDADLAFEVRKHGYKVVYQPQSVLVHFEGRSNGTDIHDGQKAYQTVNSKKFNEKWIVELAKDHFKNGADVFLARDRSKRKKTLLMVDHYVPMFDRDAGSRTVFQYLKLFVKHGYNVKFIGDNFYKHEPYTIILQQMGIEVLYGNHYYKHWDGWLKENARCFDLVWLNRPHISVKYIDEVKRYTKAKVVYYGHDLHFLRATREYEISGEQKLLKESENWKKQELLLMRKSDVAFFPSSVEVEKVKEIDGGIDCRRLLINVLEPKALPRFDSQRSGMLFVGGFAHTPNVDAVKWFVDEVLPQIRNGGVSEALYIVGSNPTEEITKLASDDIILKQNLSDTELESVYNSCRIAIVPLRYGAGVKGKVVEAMYKGIPLITTSVGAEGLPEIADCVIIADNASDFAECVIDAYKNEDNLKTLRNRAWDYINRHFSEEQAWKIVGGL